ncbi:endothelial cell adhesion molecule a [Periophthalmus magnuspinnatus]|uniref:endothelial cell adhesion molecule a n=1 Tax=Periophthalmus magnuspinnatus TaxID=409849 RepID=UPI002436A837|nr:endothelial cell adhesion molecule a [Periophthalmus magnuspinnatus]
MEVYATQRKLTLLVFAFCCGLPGLWAEIVLPQTNVDVIKGQTAVLRASYKGPPGTDPSTNTVIWNFVSDNTQLIISYTKNSVNVGSSQFTDRVGFTDPNPVSNISLYINNTQESDSGKYLCQVIFTQSPGFTAQLSLDVKVPPAVPKCSMSGKPVAKGNVTLSCTSSAGKPIPVYKWKKTSPVSEVFFSPMLDERTGTLKLANLSSSMSGKYVCTASNTAGSESCFINLEVISSTNVGMIVGAVVGSVVGFLFLLLLCILYLLKKRRDNEDDMANEIKEDAQAPKRVSWAKSNMGSDIISKNGTLSSIASSPRHHQPSHHHHDNHHHNNHHHPHQQLQQYPQRAASDTASIVTATGSMAGYRPSRQHGSSTPTPTHYGYNYNASTLPIGQASEVQPERSGHLPQAQAVPQTYAQHTRAPSPPPLPTSTVTHANIARMGGVPIMVPAQNQAGSLV